MEYPDWGKPRYYNFKRKEAKSGEGKLTFHGSTTYNGAYKGSPPKSSSLSLWDSVDRKFVARLTYRISLSPEKTSAQRLWTTTKMRDQETLTTPERLASCKPEPEKITTYSFPGQFLTTNDLLQKLRSSFEGQHKVCPYGPRTQSRRLLFDPSTQKVQYT